MGCMMTITSLAFAARQARENQTHATTHPLEDSASSSKYPRSALELTSNLQTLPGLDPARIRPHAISLGAGDLDLDDDGFMMRVPELEVRGHRVGERACERASDREIISRERALRSITSSFMHVVHVLGLRRNPR